MNSRMLEVTANTPGAVTQRAAVTAAGGRRRRHCVSLGWRGPRGSTRDSAGAVPPRGAGGRAVCSPRTPALRNGWCPRTHCTGGARRGRESSENSSRGVVNLMVRLPQLTRGTERLRAKQKHTRRYPGFDLAASSKLNTSAYFVVFTDQHVCK